MLFTRQCKHNDTVAMQSHSDEENGGDNGRDDNEDNHCGDNGDNDSGDNGGNGNNDGGANVDIG